MSSNRFASYELGVISALASIEGCKDSSSASTNL